MSITSEPVVTTTTGKIEGYFKDSMYVFKGVPYAAPPVGEKRWSPPEPVLPWRGVRETKEFGAIAPQNEQEISIIRLPVKQVQSEDCLFLNVMEVTNERFDMARCGYISIACHRWCYLGYL